ncbi:MAG: zinc ribbon domain-containing protein [Acutalibacteraceae bacterium]|nr:zinc ribbon domain-containing protein [Acutalibacteraceae bacterium]
MFCKNCGSNIPENVKFCAACGTPVEGVATAEVNPSPAEPKKANPIFANLLKVLKEFWIRPVPTVVASAKSTTHEWSLLAAIEVILYALATAVVGLEMMSQLMKALIGGYAGYINAGDLFPFLTVFGIGLAVGAVAYFGTSLGFWVLLAKVLKKNASFVSVLNMVAAATLPLAAISIVNMLFGLVYSPITVALFVAALVMSVACLYVGIQKLDKLDKSPFYGFGTVLAIVIVVAFLMGLLYLAVVGNSIGNLTSAM